MATTEGGRWSDDGKGVVRRGQLRNVMMAALVALGCNGDAGNDYRVVTCSSETLMAGSTCGCPRLSLPVDMESPALPPDGTPWLVNIWPFGVHGGGHPEGHPGWDFTLTADQEVRMPADGTIYEATPEDTEDPRGVRVGIALGCGLRLYLTPMRPDPGLLVPGVVLRRGDRLGSMAVVSGRYFIHFGLSSRANTPSSPTTACPSVLFDTPVTTLMQRLVDQSTFLEKSPRTSLVSCASGQTETFEFPAEDRLCNARLDEPARTRLAACLVPGANSAIW